MILLICGGEKTQNIVDGLYKKVASSGVQMISVKKIEDIDELYGKGIYIDRALIIETSWLDYTERENVTEIRNKICNFAIGAQGNNGINTSYVFLTTTDSMAELVHEEILPLRGNSVVALKQPPYSVSCMYKLSLSDITNISPSWLYNPPTNVDVDLGIFDLNHGETKDKQDKKVRYTEELKMPDTEITFDDEELPSTSGQVLTQREEILAKLYKLELDTEAYLKKEQMDLKKGLIQEKDYLDEKSKATGTLTEIHKIAGKLKFGDKLSGNELENIDDEVGELEMELDLEEEETELEVEEDTMEVEDDTSYLDDIDFDSLIGLGLDSLEDEEELETELEVEEADLEVDEDLEVEIEEELEVEAELEIEEDFEELEVDLDEEEQLEVDCDLEEEELNIEEVELAEVELEEDLECEFDDIAETELEPKVEFIGNMKKEIKANRNEVKSSMTSDIKLKQLMDVFAKRGNIMVVTGSPGAGTTTVGFNLATEINKLGYRVLFVDFDTEYKDCAIMTKSCRESIGTEPYLRHAINGKNIQDNAAVIKKGLHVIADGVACDTYKFEDCISQDNLVDFAIKGRDKYHFIIYSISSKLATGYCKDLMYISDDVIWVADTSQNGILKTILDFCNLEDDKVQQFMFSKAEIVFNRTGRIKGLFGRKVASTNKIQGIMDSYVAELIGAENLDSKFSDIKMVGDIPYLADEFDKSLYSGISYAETPDGSKLFSSIIGNILAN